jgi:hypothetical protein
MRRKVRAHPTEYAGVRFRSRLEARWAAFFALAGWEWSYEPVDMEGWTPDFWVRFACGHSECRGGHELYVEVKPFRLLTEFEGHPVWRDIGLAETAYQAPHPAAFGLDPSVSYWQMAHGAGGGEEDVGRWVVEADQLWKKAGNLTQWRPQRRRRG